MKIKDRNKWRRYKRLIAKKIRGIRSIPRKQKILTGILVLLLITGVILGNTFGRTAAEKEAKKKIAAAKKETEQVKADWEAEKEEAMRQATSYSSADIKPGSMMAKANKVREYNQRNSSKDN